MMMMQSGRLCVVLPASQQGPPKGILLGTSPGESTAPCTLMFKVCVSVLLFPGDPTATCTIDVQGLCVSAAACRSIGLHAVRGLVLGLEDVSKRLHPTANLNCS